MSADIEAPHPYRPVADPPRTHADRYCSECFALPTDAAFSEHHAAELPPGHELDDDPAAAIERVRDRAQEARAGGRYLIRHPIARHSVGPHDLAELVRRDRRDAFHRLGRSQEWVIGMGNRSPIYAAGLAATFPELAPRASATQQTGDDPR